MNCLEFEQNLPDLLYEDHKEAKSHLLACPSCAKEWEGAKEVRSFFRNLPDRTPPAGAIREILMRGVREKPGRFSWEKVFVWLHSGFGRSFAPAMVVVFFFVAGLLLLSPPKGMEPQANEGFSYVPVDPPGSVLRERLWENPFAGEAPKFQLAATGQSLAPFNPSDLQKIYEERRRSLLESDADNLLMRGRRLKTMGRMDLALQDFVTIYLFYPDYTYMSDVLMFRAQCYAALGKADKAIESLQIVVRRYPDRKDVVGPLIEQLSKTR